MPPSDLFQAIILDHYQRPRNRGELDDPRYTLEATLPSCGDHLFLDLRVEDGRVADIKFRGSGCSISMASASMMTVAVKGKPVAEATALIGAFKRMMRGESDGKDLGEIQSLQGVAKLPVRVKCATLAWSTLAQGIDETKEGENYGR